MLNADQKMVQSIYKESRRNAENYLRANAENYLRADAENYLRADEVLMF